MIAVILFFILICCGSAALCGIFRRRFEEALPISVGGIPVLMFFLGLLFGLKAAFYVVLATYSLLFVALFTWKIKEKAVYSLLKSFFSPGFVLFVFFFAFLIVSVK